MSGQSSPFIRVLHRLRLAFWRRRVIHWLVRAAWLALLVPTGVMIGYLGWGWQVPWPYWVYPMLLVWATVMLWAMRPIPLGKIVNRLDDRLGLRTRLITAYEVSQTDETADNPVVPRLLQETVTMLIDLRGQVRLFNRQLWLEIQTLTGVIAMLAALVLLDALSPRLPNVPPDPLPPPIPEPSAAEIIPPDPQLAPPPFAPDMQIQQPAAIPQALEALADALRDQAASRDAATAIDQGDLSAAAESLRRLADQLPELSEEAQQALGDALQQAADDIGEGLPGLTEPLAQGSQALEEGDPGQAGQALDELAAALEALEAQPPEIAAQPEPAPTGEETAPAAEDEGESGAEPGGEAGETDNQPDPEPAAEEERLGVEGQPLELEPEDDLDERVLQPAELDAEAGDRRTQDSPFARSGVNADNALGPDPLAYPWDKREIIRRYFTP